MENENITKTEQQAPTTTESRSMGALIGAIIIIIILVLGGIYLWRTKIQAKITTITHKQSVEQTSANLADLERTANEPDATISQISKQGTSDTTGSIEADLNATDLKSLDKELQSI